MSTATEASPRPAADEPVPPTAAAGTSPATPAWLAFLALGATIVAIPFVTAGGVDEIVASPGNTWTEIVLTLAGVAAVVAALVYAPRERRRFGWIVVGLMLVLFALQAASVAWSVAPDSSWLSGGQMLAYLAVFAGAAAVARLAPRGWPVLLGSLTAALVALSVWSLAAKVFPSALAPSSGYGFARLQAPFGYWNALALCAAMGMPCCLWLGTRRSARRLAALAVPAISVLVAVLILSYSRSADAAALVAIVAWLIVTPLRLRAIAVLLVGAVGGAIVSVWSLTHSALSDDHVTLGAQEHAGHLFGALIVVVLILGAIAGTVLVRRLETTVLAPRVRRGIGAGLLGAAALVVVAAVVAVALSSRGLGGEISHGWHELTNPAATVSASSAGRVLDVGSSRPLYWHEAIAVGNEAYYKGVGQLGFSVARLRWNADPHPVQQAHSYVFETYADLGAAGLLVTGLLLLAWLTATARAVRLGTAWSRLDGRAAAERTGMITLAAAVLAFGVQSTLDWTWFFAGVSVPALIAAGWLAGRGRIGAGTAPNRSRAALIDRPVVGFAAALLIVAALAGSWMVWRPLHSAQLVNHAELTGDTSAARGAQRADPLAIAPYELLSGFAAARHDQAAAQRYLEQATRQQPDNPSAWQPLARFFITHRRWKDAVGPLQRIQLLDRSGDPTAVANDKQIIQVFHHLQAAARKRSG